MQRRVADPFAAEGINTLITFLKTLGIMIGNFAKCLGNVCKPTISKTNQSYSH